MLILYKNKIYNDKKIEKRMFHVLYKGVSL